MRDRRAAPSPSTAASESAAASEWAAAGDSGEDGQISLYILGMVIVALMLIVVTVGITAVALARTRLMDAADSAALVAANALDERVYSGTGVGQSIPVSNATVAEAATDHLASIAPPPGVISWWIGGGTGTVDGEVAQVTLSSRVRIPMASAVVGDRASIGITVTSRARAATR